MKNLPLPGLGLFLLLSGCEKNENTQPDLLIGHWQGVSTRITNVSSISGQLLYDATTPLRHSVEFTADGKPVPGVSYKRTGSNELYVDFGNVHMNTTIEELTAKKLVYQYSYNPNVLDPGTVKGYIITTYSR